MGDIVRLNPSVQQALKNSGVVSFELVDSSSDSAAFSSALDAARNADTKNGWAVTPKSAEDLAESGAKPIMAANGGAGLAIAPDGDIEAVFKNPNSGIRKALNTLIPIRKEMRCELAVHILFSLFHSNFCFSRSRMRLII